MKSRWTRLLIVFLVFLGLLFLMRKTYRFFATEEDRVAVKNSILHLELNGVIMNGRKFLKNLKKYGEDDNIKAVVISIDSPGGAVGPSQEVHAEILRLKNETKKPIVCVSTGLLASGAYYSAVACDFIIVAPGAMVGSIGVIMQFANLEKLYDFAKVNMYSITSGKFKDSGAEYRSMRADERELFQDMITEVYGQFKKAVMDGRHLKNDVMVKYADGRVFTGNKAVELGFADATGTYEDAITWAAEKAGLGKNYELFEVPKSRKNFWEFGEEGGDPVNALISGAKDLLKIRGLNRPMMIMPGTFD